MIADEVGRYIQAQLTKEQREVCYRNGSFVVIACPGSGKTRTAGTRFAWRIANHTSQRRGVAALSFTNVACAEIERHLMDLGFPVRPCWPHFLGTIDSFVNQFIFLPFGHLVMDCERRPEIAHPQGNLHAWIKSEMKAPRLAECWRLGCDPTLFEFCTDGSLAWRGGPRKRQPNCSRDKCGQVKSVMVRAGYALPTDAMYWAMRILAEYPSLRLAIARRFPELIIDEAQDTSETQVEIVRALADAGVEMVLVGDPRQSIYGFNGARPDLFLDFAKRWPEIKLTLNFRSSQRICNASDVFAGSPGASGVAGGPDRDCPFEPVMITYETAREADLPGHLIGLLEREGVNPSRCAVLAWQHDTIAKVFGSPAAQWPTGVSSVTKALAKAATYRDETPRAIGEAHQEAMWALLRTCYGVGSFGLQYQAIAPRTPREWRRIGWHLLQRLPSSAMHLTEWSRQTGPTVKSVITDFSLEPPAALSHLIRRCNAPEAARPVADFVRRSMLPHGIVAKVIHQAKGETYDAVMVVSRASSKQGADDLTQWLSGWAQDQNDAAGTGYVAVTRPRRLLVLAVPANTPADTLAKLKEVFEIVR